MQRGPDGLFVYVVKPDQTVALQPVEVTQDDGHTAVVDKGLDDGAQVVTGGQSRCNPEPRSPVTSRRRRLAVTRETGHEHLDPVHPPADRAPRC